MMTIIRLILWKFTWNLLRQEDLLTHRILISTCSRNRMFPRLSLLFRFRNIRISDPAGYASSVTAECAADAIRGRAS